MSNPRPPRPRSAQVAKAAQAGEGSKKIWLIGAVVAVVVFAAIIAVALAQESDDGGQETAPVVVTGDALPPTNRDAAAANGLTAPEVSGTSIDGEAMSIENDGRPKVIGFVAHWCPHCRNEVPRMVDWLDEGGLPDDVDLLAVSTNVSQVSPNYPPSRWLEGEDWPILTLMDDELSTTHAAFGGGGFPYFVVLDAEGKVVMTASGELPTGAFDQLVEAARTGTAR